MPSRWFVGFLVDMRLADMPSAWCEQESFYCCRLIHAIDANVWVAEGDLELQCWFFDKLYTDMYLMRGSNDWTRALMFGIC